MFKTIMLNLMIILDDPAIANELSFSPSPVVVEKSGGTCPSGYRNGRGAYCYGAVSSERTTNTVGDNKD